MSDQSSPFHRLYEAYDLPKKTARPVTAKATGEECAAIAEQLDLQQVRKLKVEASLTPVGEGVWRVEGHVTADVIQSCVVTLVPLMIKMDEPFERTFSRFAEEDTAIDVDIEYECDDPPEPLGDGVDLGVIAIEALLLGLDPYPRAPGAAFDSISAAPPGARPLTPEAVNPFAGLVSLKEAMKEKD